MSDQVRVNGNALSWGSITAKINGDRFHRLLSLSYSDKRERVYQWGMGPSQAPKAISRGKYTPGECKIGGAKDTIQQLIEDLAADSPDGNSYGDAIFLVTAEYFEVNNKPILVELQECRVTGFDTSEEETGDPLKDELTIMPMRIFRNGKSLFDSSST